VPQGFFCFQIYQLSHSLQPKLHFIKQAVVVSVRDRKNSNTPAMMAPKILVAAKPTPSRMTAESAVPKMPVRTAVAVLQMQALLDSVPDEANSTARYTTAMPRATHKNAGVIVMVAVKVRAAAIMPIMKLAMAASVTQLHVQLQEFLPIISPPASIYEVCHREVKKRSCLFYKKMYKKTAFALGVRL